jgi:uncharacterized protein (TIGR02284 family)
VTPEDTIGQLNRLIETSKDGELGYSTAAEHVHNTQLQTIFQDYAKQRAHFALQLQAEVERLGGTAGESGSITAALHRGWIDVKSAFSGGDGSAIVAACETGEDAAVAAYERVLNMDISGQTRIMVEMQFHKVQEAHQHMLRLKEAHSSTVNQPKTEVSKGKG